MEEGKQSGSSLASDLFGAKDSTGGGSSSGVFRSLFPPPQKVVGQESSFQHYEIDNKINSKNQTWTSKNGFSGGEGQFRQEEKVQPFHYSSSIYYGGQDDYGRPKSDENSRTDLKKDGGEDNLDSESRRSWWQGSVYY